MVLFGWLAIEQYREAAQTLVARAQLRIQKGDIDAAWDDLLTCHRMARLRALGWDPVDVWVGIMIDEKACTGDRALLEHLDPDASLIAKMRNDLEQLPPMSPMVEKFDVGHRFMLLDLVATIARIGFSEVPILMQLTETCPECDRNYLPVWHGRYNGPCKWIVDVIGRILINWDIVLRRGNCWYDRVVDAYHMPSRAERNAALAKIDEDIHELVVSVKDVVFLWSSMHVHPREAVSEWLGKVFVVLCLRRMSSSANTDTRGAMQFELTKLAFSLAAYRADHDSYPAKLADLTPKYVAELPKDIFTDDDLHYRQEGDGYLLYSVGANGKDDDGKTTRDCNVENAGVWDDLVVRMPAK